MRKCIVCGKDLRKVECTGTINGMEVSFCDKDAGYCENCEQVVCKIKKK